MRVAEDPQAFPQQVQRKSIDEEVETDPRSQPSSSPNGSTIAGARSSPATNTISASLGSTPPIFGRLALLPAACTTILARLRLSSRRDEVKSLCTHLCIAQLDKRRRSLNEVSVNRLKIPGVAHQCCRDNCRRRLVEYALLRLRRHMPFHCQEWNMHIHSNRSKILIQSIRTPLRQKKRWQAKRSSTTRKRLLKRAAEIETTAGT